MAESLRIALLGADEPVGTEVLRLLEERGLEPVVLFPLTLADTEGCVTIMGAEEPLVAAHEFEWREADLLISASRSKTAAELEHAAAAAGLAVIGFAAGDRQPGGAVAEALSRFLAPLELKFGVDSVDITAILPVSSLGQEGVSELVEETRALFAMESRESELFIVPIAFNLVPQTAAGAGVLDSSLELETLEAVRGRLGRPELAMTMTAIWAPVFYGVSMSVHAVLRDEAGLDEVRAALAGHDDIVLMDADLPGTVPTPASDAQESEALFVGRLRMAAGQGHRVAVWLVADMARLEAAEIVDLLENSIEK